MLGGEAGRGEEGFHLGHSELAISANVDDLFYGKLTAAVADHEGDTEWNWKRRSSRRWPWAMA